MIVRNRHGGGGGGCQGDGCQNSEESCAISAERGGFPSLVGDLSQVHCSGGKPAPLPYRAVMNDDVSLYHILKSAGNPAVTLKCTFILGKQAVQHVSLRG